MSNTSTHDRGLSMSPNTAVLGQFGGISSTVVTETLTQVLDNGGYIHQTTLTTKVTARLLTTHSTRLTTRDSTHGNTTAVSDNASASDHRHHTSPANVAGIATGVVAAACIIRLTMIVLLKMLRNRRQRNLRNHNASPLPVGSNRISAMAFQRIEKDGDPIGELPDGALPCGELEAQVLPPELDGRSLKRKVGRPKRYRTRSKQWNFRSKGGRSGQAATI